MRTACALIVMPRSRSRSSWSSTCSTMSRGATVPVYSRSRSESVVFPWSTCAITEIARVRWVGVDTDRVYRLGSQDPHELAAEAPVFDRVGRAKPKNPKLHWLGALDHADQGVGAEPPPCHKGDRE